MKILYVVVLALIIFGCASKQKESLQVENGLPTTCEEAIKAIAEGLDEESITTLRETKKEDLIMFHFSWGMGSRNSYGLWSEKSPIRISCAKRVGEKDIHPDNASGLIIEGVWELVHENNGM